MPTYPQLQAELWWAREYQPPALADLSRRLREHYQLSADAVGSKGDNNHLYGYHRSAAWVRNSAYCTDRTYSVSETPGNRKPGDVNWVCALDVTLPAEQLIAACQRLDVAVRAGRLEKITEWYGNKDGDQRVDGYENVRNQVASSDDSHLWHLHLSFDRGRAGEDHSDVYYILTGTTPAIEEDDMDKAILIQDKTGIALLYKHPQTGQMVWSNAGHVATIPAWNQAGVPGPATVDSIAACGHKADDVAAAYLKALTSSGPSSGLTREELIAAVNEAEDS